MEDEARRILSLQSRLGANSTAAVGKGSLAMLLMCLVAGPLVAQESITDLAVQKSMATAAWWQVWLSAAGIMALIFTLRLSINANGTATAALKQSDETSKRELRAYLSVAPAGVLRMKRIEPTIIGYVALENVGNVFATDVRLSVKMLVSSDRNLGAFPVDEQSAELIGAVHPGATVRRGADKGAAPPKPVVGSKTYIYVWGGVWYTDGFETRRFTKFCHRYNAASRSSGGGFSLDPEKARYHDKGSNDAN
ncbi:hypothetical protein [Mesorhizobium sp.]|nr:hypothetical protein [Mesorhizobium sp.]TIL29509.1 MAG: hypothetical protein E5Y85_27470 [Mesorhizobium sp.]TIL50387.1 MAG: hypothetical protein E5Y83_21390 [Mesorhizobium sp.]